MAWGLAGTLRGPATSHVPLVAAATAALTNAPAAGTEVPNQQSRAVVDLRGVVNAVVQATFSVIPAAAGTCRVEYSVNAGGTWAALATSGSPHVANVMKVGALTAVPAAAQVQQCWLRIVVTGDAVADPVLLRAAVSFMGA